MHVVGLFKSGDSTNPEKSGLLPKETSGTKDYNMNMKVDPQSTKCLTYLTKTSTEGNLGEPNGTLQRQEGHLPIMKIVDLCCI